jgi:hypothetical protein
LLVAFGLAAVIVLGAGAWWLKNRLSARGEPEPSASGDTTVVVAPTGGESAGLVTTGSAEPGPSVSATAMTPPLPSGTRPGGVRPPDRRPSFDKATKPEKSATPPPQPTGKPGKRPIDVGF